MEGECRAVLARFLLSYSATSARWYPILSDVRNSLASFIGLDYHLRYIPLLCKCGLVKEIKGTNGERSHTLCQAARRNGGYSWGSFFVEHNLQNFELTNCYIKEFKKQMFFIRVGVFNSNPFTPIEQYRQDLPLPRRKGLLQKQLRIL
jgi:hypothetical protein